MESSKRKLIRIIIPRFPQFNICTMIAKTTTSVGPLFIATSASKTNGWDAEVIDENNLHGRMYPRTSEGFLDHEALQADSAADVVGFYGSITSSIPRIFELSKLYKSFGVTTIAGGKHVENLPRESLENGIDFVFAKEAEISIHDFLDNFDDPKKRQTVRGIVYLNNAQMVRTENAEPIGLLDRLPIPDFSLLRFAKIKLFPICGTRGCNSNCEFCTVKGRPTSCSPAHLMKSIKMLVEKYDARAFFEVSDHFASDMSQTIEFLDSFAEYQEKIGKRLRLTIQTRLADAKSERYLSALQRAGVEMACIGFESPIDENLISMKKGYLSQDMLAWTKKFKQHGIRIHGMFIFGYPSKNPMEQELSLKEMTKQYWRFIKRSNIDTLQILLAIPLPGTELRKRLMDTGQLYSSHDLGWEYYDGQFPLFSPTGKTKPVELQHAVGLLMKRFYRTRYLLQIIKNIVFDFPLIVFPASLTIFSGRISIVKKAFGFWYNRLFKNNVLRFGGVIVIKNWFKQYRKGAFLSKLHSAKMEIRE